MQAEWTAPWRRVMSRCARSSAAAAAIFVLSACGPSEPDAADPRDGDLEHQRAAAASRQMATAAGISSSGAQSVYTESGKLIRANESLVALGNDMFGDRVSLYQGSLEFQQTDISLPGNSALPVSVGRRHAASGFFNGSNIDELTYGHFGDWDLDIPRVHGVFSYSAGWKVNQAGSAAFQRCTRFGEPPPVQADQLGGPFRGDEYWHGNFIYIPGHSSQEILRRNGGDSPTDGASYPLTTAERWAIKCLPSLKNGTGEGFVAVLPDGTQYRFDWMVSRPYSRLYKAALPDSPPPGPFRGAPNGEGKAVVQPTPNVLDGSLILRRKEVWILPSEVTDRHGNKVIYTYDTANPWKLLAIEATEVQGPSRRLDFTYTTETGYPRIATVRTGTPGVDQRTWTYSYRNTAGGWVLATLTLPDTQSRWTFNLDGLTYGLELRLGGSPGCDSLNQLELTQASGSMTHPSGATGTFTIRATPHGRSDVQFQCRTEVAGVPETGWDVYPKRLDRFSIVGKSISGPGMPAASWSYEYGAPNDSWAPCNGCETTKTVIVTDPDGDRTRYTFGNRFRKTEGQLEKVEEGWTGASAMRTTVHRYHAPTPAPWPDPIGYSAQYRGDSDLASRHAPASERVITQDGVSFNWQAPIGGYDRFARATVISRFSNLGSKTETTTYHDNLSKWVLGQVQSMRQGSDPPSVEHTYWPSGNLQSTKAFNLPLQSFTYNDDGTLASRTDGANRTTTFANYKRGLAQLVTYPDATSERGVVNHFGRVEEVTNEVGSTWKYAYDAADRLISISQPTGDAVAYHATTLSYEYVQQAEFGIEPGHWRQTIQTGQAFTRRYFDGRWRPVVTRTWDDASPATTMKVVLNKYDSDNHKTFESYPQRAELSAGDAPPGITSSYDALGRLKQVSRTGGGTSTTTYLDGFRRQTRNARDAISTFSFQAFDEPSENAVSNIAMPLGINVSIARDSYGKASTITRSGGGRDVVRRYVYDDNRRLCKTIEPESGSTVQWMDAANNVGWRASGQNLPSATNCDFASVPENLKVRFDYDLRNRPTTTTYGDGTPSVTRTYWPDGLLKTMASSGYTWTYDYTRRRTLYNEGLLGPGVNQGIGWNVHNAYGHVAGITYPDGTQLDLAPNALGQQTQAGSYATGVRYHPNGAVQSYTLGNGITHTVTQNVRGLPEEWVDSGPSGPVVSEVYSYDVGGNVTAITDRVDARFSRTMPWYDELDRLRQATGIWGSARFDYDAQDNLTYSQVGNRTLWHNVSATTNRLDSLSGQQNLTIGYDDNGNIRQRGGQAFVFDIGNRMSRAVGVANYMYDGHGRRVRTEFDSGAIEQHLYSQAGLLMASTHTNRGATRYIYVAGKLVAEVNSQSGVSYAHTDALGSPTVRTNADRAVLSSTRYEPYGATADGANPVGIGFTGHVNDVQTGLVYMQQRYYEPLAGRFLSVDPVVVDTNSGGSFNRYAYAQNNPYRFTDPDGRSPLDVAFLLIDAAKFVGAVYTGQGIKEAAFDLGASALGTLSPIPGLGQAIKATHIAQAGLAGVKSANALKRSGTKAGDAIDKAKSALTACCCFAPGTPVLTDSGLVAIEKVGVGTLVQSRNEATGEMKLKPVVAVIENPGRPMYRLTLREESGRLTETEVTDNHPYWVDGSGWTESLQLRAGMHIATFDGVAAIVVGIEDLHRRELTYNLTVADFHTYFAGESKALVHNTCVCNAAAKASAANYRALFMKSRPDLPKGWEVHHGLPQQYEELMHAAGINIHDIQFLRGISPELHSKITTEWERFHRAAGRNPSAQQVAEFAKHIDKRYGGSFVWPGF